MLSSKIFRTIIHRYVPIRSPFDKTNYIDNFVPKVKQHWKRQEKWEDPEYNWPPKMPKYTELKGKALVRQIEDEYLAKLKIEKPYPDIRSGDLVEIQNYYSLSNKQFSTFKGLCIGRRHKKNIDASMTVLGTTSDTQMEVHLKLYSPMVKSVKILEKGSGNLRNRLNYFRDLNLPNHKAVVKGASKKYKPTLIAKEEDKAKRYKILTGKIFEDEEKR